MSIERSDESSRRSDFYYNNNNHLTSHYCQHSPSAVVYTGVYIAFNKWGLTKTFYDFSQDYLKLYDTFIISTQLTFLLFKSEYMYLQSTQS